MAEIRTLMRELVLEKLRAGEVLEIRIMDPALAHPFVGQIVDMFEQKEPDDEPGLDPGPALVAIERRDLAPIQSQSILKATCTSSCFILMIWSSLARNRSPSSVVFGFFGRIVPSDATPNHAQRFEGISNMKSQASRALALKSLQSRRAVAQKNRIQLLTVLHGQQISALKVKGDFRLSAARNSRIKSCLAQEGSARHEFSNFNLLDRKLIGRSDRVQTEMPSPLAHKVSVRNLPF